MKLKDVVKELSRIAKDAGIKPYELNKTIIAAHSELTEWEFRKLGGLTNIIKAHFPIEDKQLDAIVSVKKKNSYINQLEKALGEKQLLEREIFDIFNKNIKPIHVKSYKAKKVKKKALHREMVGMLNDTHYGLNVDKEEVGNTNSFGWKEASRRTALFVRELIEYKQDKRNEVKKLHLFLNGDLTSGIIHGTTSRDIELWVHQMNGALHILGHAVSALAENYADVVVHGIGGNHEDQPHRREGGGRVMQQKYDNYSNHLFFALSAMFRNTKNVSFNFPKTPYVFADLPAGRVMAAHGDTVFNRALGNPGRTVNVKSLSNAIKDFNSGELIKGHPAVKLLLLGHTHSNFHLTTNDGVQIYNAPSLSGIDGYAHNLAINHNNVGQLLFESTPEHIFGDSRLIKVDNGDDDKSLDAVIPIYKKELKWSK